jgi:uncharacterized LabA/DUF88 family protein
VTRGAAKPEAAAPEPRRPIHMFQRVALFVDVQNMFYSARGMYQKKVDFDALIHKMTGGRQVVRAIAYIVQTPEVDQAKFITSLLSSGYEVKSKELKKRPDGSAKGDWDMGIAIDSISISERVDVIALASGDGDFCDLVRHLKAHGIRCEVYGFTGSTAEELRYTATEFIPLGSDVLHLD